MTPSLYEVQNVENAIVSALKSYDARDYIDAVVLLAKQEYDPEKLVALARTSKVYEKLGFLAEMTYAALRSDTNTTLRQVFMGYDGSKSRKEIPLVSGFRFMASRRRRMSEVHRRWGIVTALKGEEISDALEMHKVGEASGAGKI